MLLSDRSITKALSTGSLTIEPVPGRALIQPSSVDLRLGGYIRRFRKPEDWQKGWRIPVIDPFIADTYEHMTSLEKISRPGVVIHPGEFILATTMERVRLDSSLAARLEGKSSLGRLGLQIHSTAGFIDPGFDGNPTLELTNNLPFSIRLHKGMLICQLAVYRLDISSRSDYAASGGKYLDDPSDIPVPSRYYQNEKPKFIPEEGATE